MNTITVDNLLSEFALHGISHNPKIGLTYVLAFQDAIGQSNINDLHEYYREEIGSDIKARDIFIFALLSCLDTEQAIEIIKKVIFLPIVEKQINIDARYHCDAQNKLHAQVYALEQTITDRERTIRNLEIANARLLADKSRTQYEGVLSAI